MGEEKNLGQQLLEQKLQAKIDKMEAEGAEAAAAGGEKSAPQLKSLDVGTEQFLTELVADKVIEVAQRESSQPPEDIPPPEVVADDVVDKALKEALQQAEESSSQEKKESVVEEVKESVSEEVKKSVSEEVKESVPQEVKEPAAEEIKVVEEESI